MLKDFQDENYWQNIILRILDFVLDKHAYLIVIFNIEKIAQAYDPPDLQRVFKLAYKPDLKNEFF